MSKQSKEIRLSSIKLDKNNGVALHRQLYEQLREMILNGQIRNGERLPSGRNLAEDLTVSRIVVTAAYEQLILEGYVTGKTGSGTFISDTVPDKLLHIRENAHRQAVQVQEGVSANYNTKLFLAGNRIESIPFQIGLPSLDSFPYKIWQQCANHVLKRLKSIHLGYEDTLGYWPLRKAVASYLRIARAVKCEAEQVIIVTGSQQGLNLVSKVLLQKGDCVWMEDPGYTGLKASLENMEMSVYPVHVTGQGLDIDFAHKKYGPGKLVYLTPSYQFPLGFTLSYKYREKLLEYAARYSMWVLEDDYDSEFRYQGNPLSSLQGMDTCKRVIYSGTFSKVMFPGLRLAYIVIPDTQLLPDFRKTKENIDRQSPILEQVILAKFMEDGHFSRHIRKMRLLYAQRQQYLAEYLTKSCSDYIQFEIPPAGMHLRCRVSKQVSIGKLKENLSQSGLRISFVDNFAIQNFYPGEFLLGYTAFTKYQLRIASEKLALCLQTSV